MDAQPDRVACDCVHARTLADAHPEPSWPVDFAVEHQNVVTASANEAVVAQLHRVLVRCGPRPDLCPPALLAGLVH